MCIIAVKPVGVDLPNKSVLKNMFSNNPDGAGFAYPRAGRVEIEKGFMSQKEFISALKDIQADTKSIPVIIHCRIATSGEVSSANTHPFPVSSDIKHLQALHVRAPLAVAHNGIIPVKVEPKYLSDTMVFIRDLLAPLQTLKHDFYKTDAGRRIAKSAAQSKLAFLDGHGRVELIGDFKTGADGVLYSNSSYKHEFEDVLAKYMKRPYLNEYWTEDYTHY